VKPGFGGLLLYKIQTKEMKFYGLFLKEKTCNCKKSNGLKGMA
jgi:hypothetical protein